TTFEFAWDSHKTVNKEGQHGKGLFGHYSIAYRRRNNGGMIQAALAHMARRQRAKKAEEGFVCPTAPESRLKFRYGTARFAHTMRTWPRIAMPGVAQEEEDFGPAAETYKAQ
ncbi:hypothetical protein FOZ63_019350, partial [Perkinsus olseni]